MTEHFKFFYEEGMNHFKKKNYHEAIEALSKANRINPTCNIYYYLGESFLKIRETRKAIHILTVGLLRCPRDIEIKNSLSELTSDFSSDAYEEEFRKNILSTPGERTGYFQLACKIQEKPDVNSTDEAIELFETIIELYPDFTDAYMLLALSYDDKGLIDKAIEIDEKVVRLYPNFNEIDNVFYGLEKYYQIKGNYQLSIKKYKSLLKDEKNKDDVSYHFALGEAYLNNGDLLGAKDEFSFIWRKFPTSPMITYTWKKIEEKIKQIETVKDRINKFERKFRLFIERKFLENNREIFENAGNSELYGKIRAIMQTEIKKKPYQTIEELNPLNYFTILDYDKLIETNWDLFEKVFLSKKKLNQNIEFINDFRNQVAHNRIFEDKPSLEFCVAALSWFEKILRTNSLDYI